MIGFIRLITTPASSEVAPDARIAVRDNARDVPEIT
jgi:hypothetical protein